ncbi:hypothetical protein VPH35_132329 [Triticum aestivum]
MKDPNISTNSFKQAFLKNLLLGLQLQAHTSTSFSNGAMSLHERKRAVKSSMDVAMAAAHSGGASRGSYSFATNGAGRKPLFLPVWPKAILAPASRACKMQRCRRILRRSGRAGGGDIAGRLVSSRTMALREAIPATLLREAMDYAMHMRAQVDVLRWLSETVQTSSSSDSNRALPRET